MRKKFEETFEDTFFDSVSQNFEQYFGEKTSTNKSRKRLFKAKIPNIAFGITEIEDSHVQKVTLADGGFVIMKPSGTPIRHNFASTPLLWRNSDVVLMCDSNRSGKNTDHLHASIEQALILEYPFITNRLTPEEILQIESTKATVFNLAIDPTPGITVINPVDSDLPIVIYIQAKENGSYNDMFNSVFDPEIEDFTDTSNFLYSRENYAKLSGLSEHIITDEEVVNLIKVATLRKMEFLKNK